MSKITRVKYFTEERKSKINPDNIKLYDRYLKSSILKNKDVENTTYKVYKNYMDMFLVFLSEQWDNIGLYDPEFFKNSIDVIEGYMGFCQETLHNNKKVINTKISTISSFYLWSLKRRLIDRHPFDKQIDRMKGASEEKIINSYFLNDEEIEKVSQGITEENGYDIIDKLLWNIMLDSANRIGAIDNLKLSNLDIENCMFTDIREKRGYRVEVVVSEPTMKLIEEWLEQRKSMDNLEVDAFFISNYGGEYRQMTKSTLQYRIKSIGKILGLEDFHSHCIRKTTLNNIYDKTGDLSLAAEMGNHKSTETTRSSYIKPKSKTEIRDKIKELMDKKKE